MIFFSAVVIIKAFGSAVAPPTPTRIASRANRARKWDLRIMGGLLKT